MTCTIFRGYEFGDKRLTDRVIASKQQSRYASECQQSEIGAYPSAASGPFFNDKKAAQKSVTSAKQSIEPAKSLRRPK